MKIALAQIDARLGDLAGISERIGQQMSLASRAGARLLCVPAPLLAGVTPTMLAGYRNFETDMLRTLSDLASRAEELGLVCLVPALIQVEGNPMLEVYVLREGHVTPARLTLMSFRDDAGQPIWAPPVFEVAGTRIAVTFDPERDCGQLPSGCDLLIAFQADGLDLSDERTSAVAAVPDGCFSECARRAGVWLALMAPVGGFDSAVFTGGSFVMDDSGCVVAAAPCFEEGLIVQEVERGMPVEPDAAPAPEPVAYDRLTWLWEGLRIHLRDFVRDAGGGRVLVPLKADIPSALLLALAVDALGPRNVLALLVTHPDFETPCDEALEGRRVSRVRELAQRMGVRLIEREAADLSRILDRDAAVTSVPGESSAAWSELEAVYISDTARVQGALALSSCSKTDVALRPHRFALGSVFALAPFGDVWASELVHLAEARNRRSPSIPEELLSASSRAADVHALILDAVERIGGEHGRAARSVMGGLTPERLDAMLAAHVERGLAVDEEGFPLDGSLGEAEAARIMLMLVRSGERCRRLLPPSPTISSCSFAERAWPMALAWSDLGLRGGDPVSSLSLAREEHARIERGGAARGERMRGEVVDFLGELLGLDERSRAELKQLSDDDTPDRLPEAVEERMRRLMEGFAERGGGMPPFGGAGPIGSPFSPN